MQDARLEHRGEKVVRGADRVDVAGEVEVEVLHRHDLRVAGACGAALDPEHRAERGLAQAEHGVAADVAEALRQRDGGRGLAFAGLRRRDRRDADELAVGPVGEAVEHGQRDLRLVLAVEVDLVGLEPGGGGDLADRPEVRILCDLEGRRHLRGQGVLLFRRRGRIHHRLIYGRYANSSRVLAAGANRGLQPHEAGASLADKAYHAIRELIVSLELPPGAVIDERALIERLSIGRTPVREALRRLAQERLVEVYPRRGMFVTGVDIRELARISRGARALEPEAARLAAERATEAERADAARAARRARGAGSRRAGADGARRAHPPRRVPLRAQPPASWRRSSSTTCSACASGSWRLDRARELDAAVRQHQALLEAIRDGDGVGAAADDARTCPELRAGDASRAPDRV